MSYAEALERFTALWTYARQINPTLGAMPSEADWRDDLRADLAIARAVNGLPPTA
ncbi:MAG TPA: hypothetical protein VFK13_06115 [Gemmatimonadaceae bacterium]|nr:hypothetical protein [Gemmatimonadaceae bacterium]